MEAVSSYARIIKKVYRTIIMAKILVFNVPMLSRVNPTLAVVQELVARGEQVVYYCTEAFEQAIRATGADFRGYTSLASNLQISSVVTKDRLSTMPQLMIEEARNVLPQIIADVTNAQADLVLYDHLSLWGKLLAEHLQVPAALFRPTYAVNEHFSLQGDLLERFSVSQPALMQSLQQRLDDLCASYHLPPLSILNYMRQVEPLTIVFLPRLFQPAAETFDERFVFVGPAITPRADSEPFQEPFLTPSTKPLLYISLGTIFNNQADFFRICIEAFGDQEVHVLLVIGNHVRPEELGNIPANIHIHPNVPQLEVLQHTDIFITHGGMNSTMEALYNAVPLVILPQQSEQTLTARRVAELGAGITLDPQTISANLLKEAVSRLLADPTIKACAYQIQKSIHDAGGYRHAADAIQTLYPPGHYAFKYVSKKAST